MQEWEEHASGFHGNNFQMAHFLSFEVQRLMHDRKCLYSGNIPWPPPVSEVFSVSCPSMWVHGLHEMVMSYSSVFQWQTTPSGQDTWPLTLSRMRGIMPTCVNHIATYG